MFCSGGNDNKLFVWTPKATNPIFKSSAHKAAVKALAWSPHQHGLLASGGGTADRCIRFWNAHLGKMVNCIDTGSQVCNLLFSKNVNELVSTHGYTHNQIHLWQFPRMKKMAT
jgi:cell division cycle 20-like protein 1 (cofactor of APC complex)